MPHLLHALKIVYGFDFTWDTLAPYTATDVNERRFLHAFCALQILYYNQLPATRHLSVEKFSKIFTRWFAMAAHHRKIRFEAMKAIVVQN